MAKQEQFKEGDIVMLKSGGPKMTVSSTGEHGIWCHWFSGTKAQKERFAAESLQRVTDDQAGGQK
jgi:uncharacterized protein YodC (DUF2158 family)